MKHLIYTIYIIAAYMTFASCSNSKPHGEGMDVNTVSGHELTHSKYLYIDDKGCIHLRHDCIVFIVDSSNYAVKRLPSSSIKADSTLRFCSHCVSDENYENIIKKDTIGTALNR